MAVGILCVVLFAAAFAFFQAVVMAIMHTTPYAETKRKAEQIKGSKGFRNFMARKQLALKKSGADSYKKVKTVKAKNRSAKITKHGKKKLKKNTM